MTAVRAASPVQVWLSYNDACNKGDRDCAAQFLDAELVVLTNGRASVASPVEDWAVQDELLRSYPNYFRDFVSGVEHGDGATIEWWMHGVAAAGVAPSALDVPGCSIIRCREGRIVEARLYHPTGTLDAVAARALCR